MALLSPATETVDVGDWPPTESNAELSAIFGSVELTEEQRDDLAFLGASIDSDGCAKTHTVKLAALHRERNKPGIFKTISPGTRPDQPNVMIWPIRGGGWSVVRFGKGCTEAVGYWTTSANGWTRCRFGVAADIDKAAHYAGCVQTENGYFAPSGTLPAFLEALNAEPSPIASGVTIERKKRKRKLRLSTKAGDGEPPRLWGVDGRKWVRFIDDPTAPENTDFTARIYKRDGIKNTDHVYFDRDGVLRHGTRQELIDSLTDYGLDAEYHVRRATNRPWSYSHVPFKGEYPGGHRVHAMHAAQFATEPQAGTLDDCPTFAMILDHCGAPLDEAVAASTDCKALGIQTGPDYLIAWVRCLFQRPDKPLPYLGIVGPQEGGKSAFHESTALCMRGGYAEIDEALRSSSGFNASMEGAILCVIEETNIGASGTAYDRLKKFITGKEIVIRRLYSDGYAVPNYSHWIQTTNNVDALPIFRGDTRVTAWRVPAIAKENQIDRETITARLTEELPQYLGFLLDTPAIESSHRLTLPALRTDVFDDAIYDPIGDAIAATMGTEFTAKELFDAVQLIDRDAVATPAALGKKLRGYGCEQTDKTKWRQLC
ncbi:DUF5906 domain-containing protein [Rubripirellula obstinata]|nr:DUF5906 domain-containing protein [Rubripirellula obstinata]